MLAIVYRRTMWAAWRPSPICPWWQRATPPDSVAKVTHMKVCVRCMSDMWHRNMELMSLFDSYKYEPITKYATQQRRTGTCSSVTVNFAGDMIIQSNKDDFLNKTNKHRFIHFLSHKLERARCSTEHSKHDTDVLIVQTALPLPEQKIRF